MDGPTSVLATGRALENVRNEQGITRRSTIIPRGGYPNESNSDSHDNRRPYDEEGPLEEGDIKRGVEGHQIEKIVVRIEVTLEEEDLQIEIEDPQMMEDPLMVEDPLEMDEIQDDLEDEDHEDLLDQYALL